jgi:hypothetical protein
LENNKPKKRTKKEVLNEIEKLTSVFNYKPLERTDVHNLEQILLILKGGK